MVVGPHEQGGTPYTAGYVRGLFRRLNLPNTTSAAALRAFQAAPSTNVFLVILHRDKRGQAHIRTVAPRSSRLDCTVVTRRPESRWRCGFDAWSRYMRFLYYLYAASSRLCSASSSSTS